MIFDGEMTVPTSYCSAAPWNPCDMCPENTVRKGETCECANANEKYNATTKTCSAVCSAPFVESGNECVCPHPFTKSGDDCVCSGEH